MDRRKIRLIDWILDKPEGKQFLTALLITVLTLVSCIIFMEIRYERNVQKLQDCKEEQLRIKKKDDSDFLDYIIRNNEKSERKNEILDSLNNEVKKILK